VDGCRFARVSGPERALLGFSRADWLAADFLENALAGGDRTAVPALLAEGARSGHIVRDCLFRSARGEEVQTVLTAVASDIDPSQITGQIIVFERGAEPEPWRCEALPVDVELSGLLTGWLGVQARTLSGYGSMLERHLSAQQDDVGSEYALAMRDAISELEGMVRKLRWLTGNKASGEDVATVIELLRTNLRVGSDA
jgi:hypothetical protein